MNSYKIKLDLDCNMNTNQFYIQLNEYYGVRATLADIDEMERETSDVNGDVLSSFFSMVQPMSPDIHFMPLAFFTLMMTERGLPLGCAAMWAHHPVIAVPVCVGRGMTTGTYGNYGQGSHFALFVIDRVLDNIRVYDSDLNFGAYDNHVVTRLREAFECMEFPVFFLCSYVQEDYSNDCAIFVMRNALFEITHEYEHTTRTGFAQRLRQYFFPSPPPFNIWDTISY